MRSPDSTSLAGAGTGQSEGTVPARTRPWAWVPTLYVAEGFPYAVVVTVSVILYKDFGISNTRITFYTSWLYLPWVIKPLWSPLVDILKTRRAWIWFTQLVMGAALAGVALTLPAPNFFRYSLAFFWLLAFCSATHDIAADGFYMLALAERQQSFFLGIRNTSFRVALFCAQGLLVVLAGKIQEHTGNRVYSWTAAFLAGAALFGFFALYHGFRLPRPRGDLPGRFGSLKPFLRESREVFAGFFAKPGMLLLLAFMLAYRLGEAQLLKLVNPFLLDKRTAGGLELTVAQVGVIYGAAGAIALVLGGILGGIAVSRHGLKAWLWVMVCAMHLPDGVFVLLSWLQPRNLGAIAACVSVEQFGYGFGFTAYMLYLIHIARGAHQTAHYAICTGFMALGMMVPGLWSGWLQDHIGYRAFFVWVIVSTIPGFLVAAMIPLERDFGKRA